MGVSTSKRVELWNEGTVITERAAVLTGIVVADTDGTYYGAHAALVCAGTWGSFLDVGAPIGGTGVWFGRIECPYGIEVWMQCGNSACPATVFYE